MQPFYWKNCAENYVMELTEIHNTYTVKKTNVINERKYFTSYPRFWKTYFIIWNLTNQYIFEVNREFIKIKFLLLISEAFTSPFEIQK